MRLRFSIFGSVLLAAFAATGAELAQGDGYAGTGELVTMFSTSDSGEYLKTKLNLPANKVQEAHRLAQEFRTNMDLKHVDGHKDTNSDQVLRQQFNKKIAELFSQAEAARLGHFSIEQKGPAALLDSNVASRLDLNQEQRNKLKSINSRIDTEEQDAINKLPRVTPQYLSNLRSSFRMKKESEMSALLTSEQRQIWSKILTSEEPMIKER